MLFNVTETAKQLNISVHELRQGTKAGRYPFLLCGNKHMYDVDIVREAIVRQMHANQREALECLVK